MSKKDIAIRVNDIHKEFILPQHKNSSFKQVAVNIVKKNKVVRQKVLDGVSFSVYKGEFFGIVGRNGSGKSTLLKLMAGVYSPNSGSVEVNGGLTPFIELGVGFNPELSGRDNVYLNGALLGFTRKQIDEMYQDIVDFSELEQFMDQKLKNYSSGMHVRLAFSIAVKAKNDILIFDEVLAVGDAAFQKKCMKVFEDYRRNKQTVILVTHTMENVKKLCTRAMMLSEGKIKIIGSVKSVANSYDLSNQVADEVPEAEVGVKQARGVIRVSGNEGSYYTGDTMKIGVRWPENSGVDRVGVAIHNEEGLYIFGSNTLGKIQLASDGIDYSVKLDLAPGKYYLAIEARDKAIELVERLDKALEFSIYDDYKTEVNGLVRLDYRYKMP